MFWRFCRVQPSQSQKQPLFWLIKEKHPGRFFLDRMHQSNQVLQLFLDFLKLEGSAYLSSFLRLVFFGALAFFAFGAGSFSGTKRTTKPTRIAGSNKMSAMINI